MMNCFSVRGSEGTTSAGGFAPAAVAIVSFFSPFAALCLAVFYNVVTLLAIDKV